jgi:hypothetical protein
MANNLVFIRFMNNYLRNNQQDPLRILKIILIIIVQNILVIQH